MLNQHSLWGSNPIQIGASKNSNHRGVHGVIGVVTPVVSEVSFVGPNVADTTTAVAASINIDATRIAAMGSRVPFSQFLYRHPHTAHT